MKETETLTKESTLTGAENPNNVDYSKNKELIERYQIPDSPFTVISMEDKHFAVCGEYRMTDEMESKSQVVEEVGKITWNRIIQVMIVLEEIRKRDAKFNEQIQNTIIKD